MTEFCVRSDVMPDGSYGVSVTVGDDHAFCLDRPAAIAYATACYQVATIADHCTAIMRLFTSRDLAAEDATEFAARHLALAHHDHAATAPMRYTAAIARPKTPPPRAGALTGLIMVHHSGSDLGWIDPEQMRDHAAGVLIVLAASRLDAVLLRSLVVDIGLKEPYARATVADLARFMPGGQ